MNKPKTKTTVNLTKKQEDSAEHNSHKYVAKPTLYSSIVETEFKMRQISLSSLEQKPITNKVSTRELNFPSNKNMFDYANMVDVGLNSVTKIAQKPKHREVHSMKKPEPKLSDYYRPNFDNVQRIQMNGVKTTPELTLQYDGLAVSRLLNEIDDLVLNQ